MSERSGIVNTVRRPCVRRDNPDGSCTFRDFPASRRLAGLPRKEARPTIPAPECGKAPKTAKDVSHKSPSAPIGSEGSPTRTGAVNAPIETPVTNAGVKPARPPRLQIRRSQPRQPGFTTLSVGGRRQGENADLVSGHEVRMFRCLAPRARRREMNRSVDWIIATIEVVDRSRTFWKRLAASRLISRAIMGIILPRAGRRNR
jgi:hypothetical protein